jgi:transcription factor E2F3
MVDKMIKELQTELNHMARDPAYAEFAYLTFDDIMELNADQKDTLIAVKAPLGSRIEMPDPDQLFEYFTHLGYAADQIKKY